MYRHHSFLLAAFCAVLAFLTAPADLVADPSQPAPSPDQPTVERMTRTATIYNLGGNHRRASITINAHNFQATDGTWHPIREELDAITPPSSGIEYQCVDNGLVSQFGTQNGLPLVKAGAQGAPMLGMTPTGMLYRNAAGTTLQTLQPNATTSSLHDAKTLRFANLFAGATDEYQVGPEKVKHSLLLGAPALQAPAGTAWIGATYEINLPAGHTVRTADGGQVSAGMTVDGGLSVRVNGVPTYRIRPVFGQDSSESIDGVVNGRYTIESIDADRIVLTMEVPAAWATDPARVLPVAIDPTLDLQPDNATGLDNSVYDLSPNGNYGQTTINYAGRVSGVNLIHALQKFDLSPIQSFAQITSVTHEIFHQSNSMNGNELELHVVTSAWDETTTWNQQPTIDNNIVDTIKISDVNVGVYRSFSGGTINTMVQDWVSGAVVNNGLTFRDPDATIHGNFDSCESGTAARRPHFTVDYDLGPQIQSPAAGNLPDGYIGTAYNQTYTITGGQAPISWSIIAGSLPTGLNIDTGTGAITGNPSAVGSFSFTVEVKDNNNLTDTQAQTIQIYNALAITNPPAGALADGIENIAYTTVTVTATGGKPTLVWSISAGSLPTGLSLNTANGQITGTPTVANVYNFTVRVADANAVFVERAYTITVYDLPTITSPAPGALLPEGYVGAAFSRQINAAGGVFPYTWDISAGALPPGLSINPVSGLISGNPTTTGNYSFSVRVTDSNTPTPDNDVEAYTLQILTLPTITSPAAGPLPNATRNAPNYTQTFTGTNGKTPYNWSATGLPAGMTLNSISGVLNGTPTASGVFNITVTLTDANLKSDAKNYQLTVNAAVQITTTSLPDGEEDALYSQTPTVTGGTAPITWTLGISPSLPELTIDANTGEISGTPALGAQGTYQLSITATDSLGGTHNRNISIFITQPGGGTAANCGCNSSATTRDNAFAGWLLLLLPILMLVTRRRPD